mgnify:FL=1
MKTMVVISHPTIQTSSSQQFFLATLKGEESVAVRHLDEVWSEAKPHFTKSDEEKALADSSAQRLILQFPMYWYQAPSVMKEWIDTVMSKSALFAKQIKELGIVVTLGVKEEAFRAGGKEQFTISELLRPFQALANAMRWTYLPIFEVHQFDYKTEEAKQALLVEYLQYVTKENHGTLQDTEEWFIQRAQAMEGVHWEQIAEWIKENQDERLELEMHLSHWEESQYGDY